MSNLGISYRKSKDGKTFFMGQADFRRALPNTDHKLLDRAIKEAQDSTNDISDPIRYVETIYERLAEKKRLGKEKAVSSVISSHEIEMTKENKRILEFLDENLPIPFKENKKIKIYGHIIFVNSKQLMTSDKNFKILLMELLPEIKDLAKR